MLKRHHQLWINRSTKSSQECNMQPRSNSLLRELRVRPRKWQAFSRVPDLKSLIFTLSPFQDPFHRQNMVAQYVRSMVNTVSLALKTRIRLSTDVFIFLKES